MEPEQRGRIIALASHANPSGEEHAVSAKPFDIPKRLVWNAWRLVRANRGSAGVDEISLDLFERDLKNNLYQLWNRMSSGSYFPPPVKEVMIPKKSGGECWRRDKRTHYCRVKTDPPVRRVGALRTAPLGVLACDSCHP